MRHRIHRRRFLASTFVFTAGGFWLPPIAGAATAPTPNPLASLRLGWTDKLRWDFVVNITTLTGDGDLWDERLEKAQAALFAKGGGVVFFPAGTYRFAHDIKLQSNVILRGAEPEGIASARDEKFSPLSKLEFPKYVPGFSGSGTPVNSAFKGIVLADPATAANCGVVHLAINRGHVALGEAEDHRCGASRFVFGCVLRHAAGVMAEIPNAQQNQPAWLRYTHKFRPAIRVHASENALVANNRISKSGEDNFVMKDYPLLDRQKKLVPFDVEFDYDNRPGVYVKNVTRTNGIRVQGWPAEKVVVKDNRHLGAKPGKLINEASAELANNANYEVVVPVKK